MLVHICPYCGKLYKAYCPDTIVFDPIEYASLPEDDWGTTVVSDNEYYNNLTQG